MPEVETYTAVVLGGAFDKSKTIFEVVNHGERHQFEPNSSAVLCSFGT